jgi:hypothetical protein
MSEDTLIAIVSVSVVFGAPTLWFIADTVAKNWRKVRIAEQNAALKRDLIAQGYTADEIVRVLNAGTEKDVAGREAQRPARCHR